MKNVRDFSTVNDEDEHDSWSAGELKPHSDTPTLIALHSLQPVMTDGESYFFNARSIQNRTVLHVHTH
jgi:hypothetical protein